MTSSKETKGSAEMAEEALNGKASFHLEDLESGKSTPQQGWLKEVWGKWLGDEPIEELLAALKDD